jgi:hypothetical protein
MADYMGEDDELNLRLDDTIEAQEPMEVEVDHEAEVEDHEAEPEVVLDEDIHALGQRLHDPLDVIRNYTKYEVEGSPTMYFDEFNKGYIVTKNSSDSRSTVYLKCHRYTMKRGSLFPLFCF